MMENSSFKHEVLNRPLLLPSLYIRSMTEKEHSKQEPKSVAGTYVVTFGRPRKTNNACLRDVTVSVCVSHITEEERKGSVAERQPYAHEVTKGAWFHFRIWN